MQVNESWWLKLSTVGTIIVRSNFWNSQVNFFFTMLVHKLGKSTNNLYSQMKILFLSLVGSFTVSSWHKLVKQKSLMTKITGLEDIVTGIARSSINAFNRRGSWSNKVIFTWRDNRALPFHSSVALTFLAAPLCTQLSWLYAVRTGFLLFTVGSLECLCLPA